jgi:hypothetical protein
MSRSGTAKAHKRKDGTGVFVIVRHELALQPGLAVWEAFHDPKHGQVKLDGETECSVFGVTSKHSILLQNPLFLEMREKTSKTVK